MVIRKQFKFEGSHIVRCCSSERCAQSIHGHSYIVEVFLKSKTLDKGGMVLDFGLLKPFKQVVDMFDHTHLIWSGDLTEYKEDVKKWCKRWIELPFNPSAENLAFLFHCMFSSVLSRMQLCNGEGKIKIKSVRVHETATGYAETEKSDLEDVKVKEICSQLVFSDELERCIGREYLLVDYIGRVEPVQILEEYGRD